MISPEVHKKAFVILYGEVMTVFASAEALVQVFAIEKVAVLRLRTIILDASIC